MWYSFLLLHQNHTIHIYIYLLYVFATGVNNKSVAYAALENVNIFISIKRKNDRNLHESSD